MKYIFVGIILLLFVGCGYKSKDGTKPKITVERQKIASYIKEKVDNYIKSGEEAIEKQEYLEAVRLLKRAERLDTDNAYIYFLLGKAYEAIGWDRESIEYYVKALKIDPQIASKKNKKL